MPNRNTEQQDRRRDRDVYRGGREHDEWRPAEPYRTDYAREGRAGDRGSSGYGRLDRAYDDHGDARGEDTTGGWYGGAIGAHMERGFSMMDVDHRGHGPEGYARADERIHGDVCDRLTDDRHVDARGVGVKVTAGTVTLTGQVADRHMKWRAEEIAEHVSGVKEVDNQIRVRRPPEAPPAPDEMARKSRTSKKR